MSDTMQNVKEALSPEEKPIIENIIGLFQQLLQMQEASKPDMAIEETLADPADEAVAKSADGETGDDPAEKRIEEVTPTTDQSINDLKKSIAQLTNVMGNRQVVKKSTTSDNGPILAALGEINKVMKGIVEKQNTQEKFNQNIMNGLGFTDDVVKKSLGESEVSNDNSKPVQSLDTKVMKDLLTEVFKSIPALNQNQETRHPFNDKRDVRKNLRGLAEFIHHGK